MALGSSKAARKRQYVCTKLRPQLDALADFINRRSSDWDDYLDTIEVMPGMSRPVIPTKAQAELEQAQKKVDRLQKLAAKHGCGWYLTFSPAERQAGRRRRKILSKVARLTGKEVYDFLDAEGNIDWDKVVSAKVKVVP